MDTSQLLDLFTVSSKKNTSTDIKSSKTNEKKASMNDILAEMGDLWDEKQYETEYDLNQFMMSLKQ